MEEDKKTFWGWVDFIFNKALPKKFIVVATATIFVFTGKLDGDMWAYLAMIYMGTNGLQHLGFDLAGMMKARKE